MEIKMNKLILTLGFGILASSAFAGNLDGKVETAAKAHAKTAAHTAYTHAKNAKTAGNLETDAQTDEKQISAKKAEIKEKAMSDGKTAMSDGKNAYHTDAA